MKITIQPEEHVERLLEDSTIAALAADFSMVNQSTRRWSTLAILDCEITMRVKYSQAPIGATSSVPSARADGAGLVQS